MKKLKDSIQRVKRNGEAKTLLSNFAYLSVLQVVGYVFPLFTIPYLARVIGVDSFGKIAFASAIIVWFQTISDWGFNFTATRDVAKNRNDKDKVSEIFSNVLWARIFLMAISFIVLLALLTFVSEFRENKEIILITFLIVPGYIMFPDWFFQAMEKMRYITILNILSKIIFTLAIFIFIKNKSDFILQPLFTSLGYLVSGIIAMYIILRRWKIQLYRPKWGTIYNTIRGSSDVFLNNIMPNLYNSFSVVLLGFYGGSISNGKLDSGSKFINISQQFMTVVSRTFFPFLSRRIDKHDLYVRINLLLSIVFSLALFLLAPFFIKMFFTPEFYDSILVLRIMSFSIFFLSLSNIYGTNYMILTGYERELRNITIIVSIIGLALSFPLIIYLDYIGAALTVTFTRGLLGIVITLMAKRYKKEQSLVGNSGINISRIKP